MKYKFKPLPELYFGILAAAGTYLAIELMSLNPEGISDWRAWGVALVAGCVRAAAGMTLDYLRRSMVPPEDHGATTVDALIPVLESLSDDERDELTRRLEMRDEIEAGRHPRWPEERRTGR